MKTVLFALTAGAFAAVHGREIDARDIGNLFDHQSGEDGINWERVSPDALARGEDGIDWERVSPDALGMNLEFGEMSNEELTKVAEAFRKLGLIPEEEVNQFKVSLTDVRMRAMLRHVTENWQETMRKIIKDPAFMQFLQNTKGNLDENALAQIVGLDGGFKQAIEGSN